LKRQPAHGGLFFIGGAFLVHPQCGFEAAFADETPGSNDIGDDFDQQLGLVIHAGTHRLFKNKAH